MCGGGRGETHTNKSIKQYLNEFFVCITTSQNQIIKKKAGGWGEGWKTKRKIYINVQFVTGKGKKKINKWRENEIESIFWLLLLFSILFFCLSSMKQTDSQIID